MPLDKERRLAGHEELHRRENYGKETWRVNKICQETVMKTNRGASGRKLLKDHERKLDVCRRRFTFTDSHNRYVLTEDIELQGGLCMTDHVLCAAYDHPTVIIRRQVRQGEAALQLRVLDLQMYAKKKKAPCWVYPPIPVHSLR